MKGQGQPTRAGEGGLGRRLQSAVLTAPLCAWGLDQRGGAELHAQAPSVRILSTRGG